MDPTALEILWRRAGEELDRRIRNRQAVEPALALLVAVEERLEGRESPDVPSVERRMEIAAGLSGGTKRGAAVGGRGPAPGTVARRPVGRHYSRAV